MIRLPQNLAEEVEAELQKAKDAGWNFKPLEWIESGGDQMVEMSASQTEAAQFYCFCPPDRLVECIRELYHESSIAVENYR